MAILKIARLGTPVLRQISEPVPAEQLQTPELQAFIDDLIETMRDADGAGLAAPQVYRPIRIVLIEVDGNPRYPDFPNIPLTVLVNPEIAFTSDEKVRIWEGCLSVPNLRGLVPRRRHIHVDAMDRHGRPIAFEARDTFAGIVQHECDHLDGKLFVDRVDDSTSLTFLQEFQRYRADDPHIVTD